MKRILSLLVLLIFCGYAAAQENYDNSAWRQAGKIRRDYINRLKEKLAADPRNRELQIDLLRAYYVQAVERDEASLFEAEKMATEILSRDQNDALAIAYRGSILGLKIDYGLIPEEQIRTTGMQAGQLLDRAVSLAPQSIEIRQLRGYLGFNAPPAAGRGRQAVEDFAEAIRMLESVPDSLRIRAETYLSLGDAYRKINSIADARASWEKAKELLPDSQPAVAAEMRLRSFGDRSETEAINIRELTALPGFLIGTLIFSILTFLIARDLISARRQRKGMISSLAVSLTAFLWNVINFAFAVLSLAGVGKIDWYKRDSYLLLALSPIPFGLIIAYRFYKATFMDIVLKRGAALIMVFALSIVYTLLVETPVRMAMAHISGETMRTIFFAGIWLWVYALYPPLRDRIHRAVDRYIFKRRDYSHLLDWFNERLRGVTEEETFVKAVTDSLKEAFTAESVQFVAASDDIVRKIIDEPLARQTDIILRHQVVGEELYATLKELRVELVMALRAGGEWKGAILVGPRAYGQGYLSEEMSVLRAVSSQCSRMLENIRLQEARRRQAIAEEELRRLATQAELKALRAQIDPHFFFNALNSVAALIGEDPEAAEELIEDLSDLFRRAFKPNSDFVSFAEELETVETYLKIEKIRLDGRLEFIKDTSPETLSIAVPALSLQPLVENAVKHGIAKSNRGGTITLSATIESGWLHISVSDTGRGMSQSELSGIFSSGVGLANVNSRLIGLFGESARLKVDSKPGEGTTVRFAISAIQQIRQTQSGKEAGISARVKDRTAEQKSVMTAVE
jgi:signal transduction histidine kinase